ncbi:hypothetical protein [Leptothrix discophora]|uniref:Uncharacterized protein n=1 Tax=Leptothrix discophora TaxID=89 RepID=A0ABT9G7V7_LEPDI|nr:hypothetical protein [Leptothrix discophora]MDP4302357.1 hypothetical protein [Leptothrix discophora]
MSSRHLAAATLFAAISATALLAMASAPAEAALPFSHPATAARVDAAPAVIAEVQARDAAPHLVGHPASPRWAVQHANAEHPAIQARARLAAGGSTVDANTFLVQPPASVVWTPAPAPVISTAAR